jgi:predicted ribonuclease YlaK
MYKGYIEVSQNDDKYVSLYNNINSNIYECFVNQYVLVKDDGGNLVDRLRWNGDKYDHLSYKQVNNNYMGKIKPLNPQQELAFDLLQSKDITVKILTGRFGSGKTYLMIANALQLINDGKFDKIIWVRNNQEVKDTKAIGALPGEALSKLLPFAMPIADHVGGLDGLEFLIKQDKVNIEHLGWIRGRSFENAIVMCSEAENLTKQHIQLLIGRIGKGSTLWLDGDFKQVDSKIFEENNGLNIAIDKLKGHRLFGYVNLEKSERSETAALADLLDE